MIVENLLPILSMLLFSVIALPKIWKSSQKNKKALRSGYSVKLNEKNIHKLYQNTNHRATGGQSYDI